MENLGDILRNLRDTRSANGGLHRSDDGPIHTEQPEEPCDVCDGRRWLTLDVPVGHPNFGKAEPCECQAELLVSERSARLRRYSNLGVLSRLTFDSTNPVGRSEDEEARRMFAVAYETALSYAEEPKGWLIMIGPNGAGKTQLAAAIANHCIEQGRPVFFVHVPDLLDDLRSTYAPHSMISYSELFDQVNDAPLLILDGLGTQSATPWAQEKLQQIFNRRANAQLPTIVTTSTKLADIDPYISSRMTNPDLGKILELGRHSTTLSKKFGNIPQNMLKRMTFDNFDTRGRGSSISASQRQSLAMAMESARTYASAPDGWLTLFGDTGVGKTHLAVAIGIERMRQGLPVLFADVPQLIDYLRKTFNPNSDVAYDQIFDEAKNAPLLILDDLGGEYRNDWGYEKLYQLIVHRHNSRMHTVITSPIDITESRGPISSRIQDQAVGMLINMDAPDYRITRRYGTRRGTPEHTPRRGRQR